MGGFDLKRALDEATIGPGLTLERKAALINGLSARANRHARIMILGDMGLQPEPRTYRQTDAILRMLSGENSILQE